MSNIFFKNFSLLRATGIPCLVASYAQDVAFFKHFSTDYLHLSCWSAVVTTPTHHEHNRGRLSGIKMLKTRLFKTLHVRHVVQLSRVFPLLFQDGMFLKDVWDNH